MKVGDVSVKSFITKIPEVSPEIVAHKAAMEEALGIKMGTLPGGNRHRTEAGRQWDPKEITPKMQRLMYLQLFNPTATAEQLANIIGLSPTRVRAILRSDMYKAKYHMRRLEIEQLENSKILEERQKFQELRDEMIKAHEELLELDPSRYLGKELEVERLRQTSMTTLLKLSSTELDRIDRALSFKDSKDSAQVGVEVELDTSDPKKAYMRLMTGFKKGTK